ncbi:MAG TPA: protein-L-isoaspartate(D-aspartate) O-methyltransferase [Vicinamibacteria bacterium]|nr:protein-L-isoaspartate(D-aspartate) O-methyltransferase [Vicinamibacteria bacterium]
MMTLLTISTTVLLSAARCSSQGEETYDEPRRRMVEEQLRARDIEDPRVLAAMGRVPRHLFVPAALRFRAYADHPLPIGNGQTISQPYIVALMTQLAEVEADDVVLEIGTGSGYQAAVLSEIVREVATIEIVPELADTARTRLAELGYKDVTVRTGDGYLGWKEKAPFDAILVTAAAPEVPPPLVEQLAPGAILVIPVGPQSQVQSLLRIEKAADGTTVTREILPVVFVPLVRERR